MKTGMHFLQACMLGAVVLVSACGKDDVEQASRIERHVARGTLYLEQGKFRPAQAEFWSVVNPEGGLAPAHCEANYGYTLAIGAELVGSLLNAGDWDGDNNGNRIGTDSFSLLSAVDDERFTDELDGYLQSFLEPALVGQIDPMAAALEKVVAGGCSFRVPGGVPVETAGLTGVRVGTLFGVPEARLGLSAMRVLQGALRWITAIDLRLDFKLTLEIVREVMAREDGYLVIRALAEAIDASPMFLDYHPERGERLTTVAGYLTSGLADLRAGLDQLFYGHTGPERADAVLGYVDANESGSIDRGDGFYLGIVGAEPALEVMGLQFDEYPISLVDDTGVVGSLLFTILNDGFLERIDALLGRVSDNIEGKGDLFNIGEVNNLIGLSLVPELVAVDLSRLFPTRMNDAVPLRRFLPAWGTYDPPGGAGDYFGDGYVTFLIELERGAAAGIADFAQEVSTNDIETYCYLCGPGERFNPDLYGEASVLFTPAAEVASHTAPVTGIPDDCSEPDGGLPGSYAWWQDPTFNGLLYVNLGALAADDVCPADAATGSTAAWATGKPVPRDRAVPGNQYSVNRLLNLLGVSFAIDPDDLF